jgi:hypothetical protein
MAFTFKLEHPDGTPADPRTLRSAVPHWSPGDTIPLGRAGRRYWSLVSVTRANLNTTRFSSSQLTGGLRAGSPRVVGGQAGAGPRVQAGTQVLLGLHL